MSYGEPWRQHKEFPYIIMTDDGLGIAEFEPTFVQGVGYSADHTEANRKAARVCAAVNALEGIRNPAAVKDVIEAAKTYHATLWTALQRLEDGASNDDVLTSAQEIRLAYEGIGMSLAALDGEAG